MEMNTHITKELAIWLKERGCEIEAIWISELNGRPISEEEYFDFQDYVGSVGMPAGSEVERFYPSYTYYDILVTHAKEFWGVHAVESHYYDEEDYAWIYHPMELLEILQFENYDLAEAYIMKHCVFAQSIPK